MKDQAYQFSNIDICKLTGKECRAGIRFLEHLQNSISTFNSVMDDGFEFSGHVCLNECSRECTCAFHCAKQAICFLGDVHPDQSIDDLFADTADLDAATLELPNSLNSNATFMRLERQMSHLC